MIGYPRFVKPAKRLVTLVKLRRVTNNLKNFVHKQVQKWIPKKPVNTKPVVEASTMDFIHKENPLPVVNTPKQPAAITPKEGERKMVTQRNKRKMHHCSMQWSWQSFCVRRFGVRTKRKWDEWHWKWGSQDLISLSLMIVYSWNIRGLNNPLKIKDAKSILASQKIIVVAFLETRVRPMNYLKIQKKFGAMWSWVDNYFYNHKGRIWLGWKHLEVQLDFLNDSEQHIHYCLHDKNTLCRCYFVAIYGCIQLLLGNHCGILFIILQDLWMKLGLLWGISTLLCR